MSVHLRAGHAAWLFLTFALAIAGLSTPVSAQIAIDDFVDDVEEIYIAYYGRPGDPRGVQFWAGRLAASGGDLQDIIDAFGTSAEFDNRFGGLDNETLVNRIFQNLFNRDADPEGLAHFVERLETGTSTLGTIALDIVGGVAPGGLDDSTFQNKLSAAQAFTDAVADSSLDYDADDIDEAVDLLAAVDAAAETLTEALAEVLEYAETGSLLDNIVELALANDDLETLVVAVLAAGLDSVLGDEAGDFTVFAPTDDAFEDLGDEAIAALLGDIDALTDVLLYHVLPDITANAETAISLASSGATLAAANGDLLALTLRDGALFINNSEVIITDVEASNGIIHVIDTVLTPPDEIRVAGSIVDAAVADERFSTLVAALTAAGLDTVLADTSSTFTVFAPTDDAFEDLGEETITALLADTETLTDILLYHVIAGGAVDSVTALSLTGTTIEMANGDLAELSVDDGDLFINEAEIVITDIITDNGIIHAIDTVIIPQDDEPSLTLLDAAEADPRFSTLVAALEATDLDDVLDVTDREFTVFAPTDDAFALLGEDTVAQLLEDTDTLSNILLYHVIADASIEAATAVSLAGSDVEMANGDSVTLSLQGEALFVNDSQVIITDLRAANGIIHVIDAVLLPPAD